jgi:hypothetical protein
MPLDGYRLYLVFDTDTTAVDNEVSDADVTAINNKVLNERSTCQLRVQSGLITVGEQQNDELVDSYLMRFERFIYMEWSI